MRTVRSALLTREIVEGRPDLCVTDCGDDSDRVRLR